MQYIYTTDAIQYKYNPIQMQYNTDTKQYNSHSRLACGGSCTDYTSEPLYFMLYNSIHYIIIFINYYTALISYVAL